MKLTGKLTRKKQLVFAAVIILLIVGTAGGSYLKEVSDYRKTVAAITLPPFDLSEIPDGSYIGEFDAGLIYAKVETVVESGEIRTVRILEHRNERGAGAEAVVGEVVKKQSLEVDAVSGATNSSRVILKAISNALEKARLN